MLSHYPLILFQLLLLLLLTIGKTCIFLIFLWWDLWPWWSVNDSSAEQIIRQHDEEQIDVVFTKTIHDTTWTLWANNYIFLPDSNFSCPRLHSFGTVWGSRILDLSVLMFMPCLIDLSDPSHVKYCLTKFNHQWYTYPEVSKATVCLQCAWNSLKFL